MKLVHPWFRNMFWVGGFLSLVSSIQLFVLGERTETFFAWTIQSPLTAATFGGFYLGAMTYGFLSARELIWAKVRAPALGLFVFTTVTLAASILHLDKFHLTSPDWLTRTAAQVWMLVYILLPPLLLITLILQGRMAGTDPDRMKSFPVWFRILLLLHGLFGITVACFLFFAPQTVIPFWSWALTLLTARVLSAWLFSFGVISLQALREHDWTRIRVFAAGYLVAGVLGLIALLRYPGEVHWFEVGNSGYLMYIAIMLVIGFAGYSRSRA